MAVVSEITYPKIYAQASQASLDCQRQYLTLVKCNIVLMASPALVNLLYEWLRPSSQKGPLIMADLLLVILAVLTTLTLFLPMQKRWMTCRGLAERAKALTWRFMMRIHPYSSPDEGAAENRFLADQNDLQNQHHEVVGYLTAQNVPNKPLGEMQAIRELALEERVALFAEHRVRDQTKYYCKKSQSCHHYYLRFSIAIVAMQGFTLLLLCGGLLSVDDHFQSVVREAVALSVAISIALLGWRDFRKYNDHDVSFGIAHQQLEPLEVKANKITTEREFEPFFERVEAILANEHRLWLLRSGEEGHDDSNTFAVPKVTAEVSDAPNAATKVSGAPRVIALYRPRPIEVKAVRLQAKTKIQTLEGEEEAISGDWLLTGTKGEQWPVSHSTFVKKYIAVPNKQDTYRKLPVEMQAVQVHSLFTIETRWGLQTGKPGDWLVFNDEGDSYVCTNEVFDKTYERVNQQLSNDEEQHSSLT